MNFFPRGIKATYAAACLLLCMLATGGFAEPVEQDTIEAAMTLQILGFTEWPEDEGKAESAPRTIGILDSEAAFAAFKALLVDPRFEGRFTLVAIDAESANDELYRCDAIFINEPDPTEIPRLVKKLESRPIVLIGTFDGFLEQGGLVNLIKRQRRLGFEIQLDNSKRRGIEYRSKLLRLAAKIVQE